MGVSAFLALQGPERGYLDNTKHLIFWLFKMKQLSFWHFNTNSKKNLWNNNFFFPERSKTGSKKANIILFKYIKEFLAI